MLAASLSHGIGTRGITPQRLFERLPDELDLRDEAQLDQVLQLADDLLERVDGRDQLDGLEYLLESQPERWPMATRVVAKLARSKVALARQAGHLHLSVVVPLYGEHERILRPSEHAAGEGFLDRKIRQLSWLCGERSDRTWDLLMVDDGCPHGSGRIAESILAERHANAPARVIYLEQAIAEGHALLADLRSTGESRKGGAVHLGLWESAHGATFRKGRQIVAYTDADLSTHLGQLGLLVEALAPPGVRIAAGSRRASTSAVVKPEGRSARGRLFIYLWKKLLPELAYVDDTQCGFKAMHAEHVGALVAPAVERGLGFDLELLLGAELMFPRSIADVPIAWIDSEVVSNTASSAPHLDMLRSAVSLSRRAGHGRLESEAFAEAIEALDEASWERAIERHGPALEPINPALDRHTLPLAPGDLLALGAA